MFDFRGARTRTGSQQQCEELAGQQMGRDDDEDAEAEADVDRRHHCLGWFIVVII